VQKGSSGFLCRRFSGGSVEEAGRLLAFEPATDSGERLLLSNGIMTTMNSSEITRARAADSTEEMDLTPMVDVTFLLLIFFMITASFSIQKSLAVPPPEPKDKGVSNEITPADIKDSSILVEIDARNLVTVDEQIVSNLDSLPRVLKAARKPEILIVAHHDSLHEVVVRVIDASNEISLQKIRVAMKE